VTRTNGSEVFSALCFGKLPGFSDFIRVNAGTREVLHFDRWLQEGIYLARERLQTDWQTSYGRAPAYCFAFHPANSQQVTLGLLVPSHDSSDRLFPFVVAVQADCARLETFGVWRAPVAYNRLYSQAAQSVARARAAPALQGIEEEARQLRLALQPDDVTGGLARYAAFLENTTVDRLWRVSFGDDDAFSMYLVFKNLAEILSPWRGRSPERLAMGLRFPLPRPTETLSHVVTFWLDIAHATVHARANARPFFFWTSPDANGTAIKDYHLFLFLREPTTRSFAYFLRPDLNSDFICELDRDGRAEIDAARAALPTRIRHLLEAPDTSLRALLQAIENVDLKTAESRRR
jgi:type VI secretion system ImpM family protein